MDLQISYLAVTYLLVHLVTAVTSNGFGYFDDFIHNVPPAQESKSESSQSNSTHLRRSTIVSQLPFHRDYHCYSTTISLHEPNTSQEAKSDLILTTSNGKRIASFKKKKAHT